MTSQVAQARSYRELGLLAEGGMALVSQGVADDGTSVVIKRIRPPYCFDSSFLRLFSDEGAVHAALCHPNIVRLLDRGEDEQGPYLVFEHVDGTDLGALLDVAWKDGRPMDLELVLAIAAPLFQALAFAHTAEHNGDRLHVVHRDVSPGNVLLGADGSVKLADFGVAASRLRSEATVVGEMKGKFAYMAPEQTRGTAIDARADLFAAGVVLWECLAGRRLFDGPTDADVVAAVRDKDAPLLSSLRAHPRPTGLDDLTDPGPAGLDLPSSLVELVASLLEKKPDDRPANAQLIADRIRQIAVERGLEDGLSRYVARAVRLAPRRSLAPIAPDVRRRTQRVLADAPGAARVALRPRRAPTLVFLGALSLLVLVMGAWLWQRSAAALTAEPLPTSVVASTPAAVAGPTSEPRAAASGVVGSGAGPAIGALPLPAVEAPPPAVVAKRPVKRQVGSTSSQPPVLPLPPTGPTTGFGRLSINAEPWGEVFVDGNLVAKETPLVGFSLPAGHHRVLVKNPVYNLEESFNVEVAANAHVRRFVDLNR